MVKHKFCCLLQCHTCSYIAPALFVLALFSHLPFCTCPFLAPDLFSHLPFFVLTLFSHLPFRTCPFLAPALLSHLPFSCTCSLVACSYITCSFVTLAQFLFTLMNGRAPCFYFISRLCIEFYVI